MKAKTTTPVSTPRSTKGASKAHHKYMTSIGLFITSASELVNGESVLLNSPLIEGKPNLKLNSQTNTQQINFGTSDGDAYIYIPEEKARELDVFVSADGGYLQLVVEAVVAPTEVGTTKYQW